MTPKELHIHLDSRLQYLNSNRVNALKAEEKDLALNRAILNVTDNRLPSRIVPNSKARAFVAGFEDNIVAYDDLKELKRIVELDVYVDPSESNLVYSILPDDYYHLINSRSYLDWSCNDLTFPSATNTNVGIYLVELADDDSGASRYDNFIIELDNGTGDTVSEFTSTTLRSADAKFQIVNKVLDDVRMTSTGFNTATGDTVYFDVYWEWYDDKYYKDKFIFVVDQNKSDTGYTLSTIRLSYDSLVKSTATVTNIIHQYYNYSFTDQSQHKNRLFASEIVYDVLDDYYGKTAYDSPVSILRQGRVNVFHNSKFIIDKLRMEYISKPRMVSLAENQSSNLSTKLQNEVVDTAVRHIKAIINDVGYKAMLQENQLNNI